MGIDLEFGFTSILETTGNVSFGEPSSALVFSRRHNKSSTTGFCSKSTRSSTKGFQHLGQLK
jgi:hypothetical protein